MPTAQTAFPHSDTNQENKPGAARLPVYDRYSACRLGVSCLWEEKRLFPSAGTFRYKENNRIIKYCLTGFQAPINRRFAVIVTYFSGLLVISTHETGEKHGKTRKT